jgi:hypothetical protein
MRSCNYILLSIDGKDTPVSLDKIDCFIGKGTNALIIFSDGTHSEQKGHLGLWIDRVERKTKDYIEIDRSTYVNHKSVKHFSRDEEKIIFHSGYETKLSIKGYISLAWFYKWGAAKEEAEDAGNAPGENE